MLAVPPTSEDAAEANENCADDRRDRPGQKAIRGIAEEHFVRVQSNPFGPHPTGDIAAEAGRQPLRYDEP